MRSVIEDDCGDTEFELPSRNHEIVMVNNFLHLKYFKRQMIGTFLLHYSVKWKLEYAQFREF